MKNKMESKHLNEEKCEEEKDSDEKIMLRVEKNCREE